MEHNLNDEVFLRDRETGEMVNLVDYLYPVRVDNIEDWKPVSRNIGQVAEHHRSRRLIIVESSDV